MYSWKKVTNWNPAFYKIRSTGLPSCVYDFIPKSSHMYKTRSVEDVAMLYRRTDIFKYLFFQSTISEWNKLNLKIQQSKTLLTFRNALIKIERLIPKPIYNVHNLVGLKLLTKLRLGPSHLNQHKINHNIQDCLNRLCSCSLEVESVSHFFLYCHYYSRETPKSYWACWSCTCWPISLCNIKNSSIFFLLMTEWRNGYSNHLSLILLVISKTYCN